MRILILDPYPAVPWRISKDTSGGYGTANRFGDGVVGRALSWVAARGLDWPPLYSVYTAGVLSTQGHDVEYARDWRPDERIDLVLVTSAIVSHETELDVIKRISGAGYRVGSIGPFAANVPDPYISAGAFVIGGEPEFFFLRRRISETTVGELEGLLPLETGDVNELPLPAWDIVFPVAPPKFNLMGRSEAAVPILATRGCPYSCRTYCVYPLQQGRKIRSRDPDEIVKEMAHWQDNLSASLFVFRDPVFSIDRKHTLAICDSIEKSGRKFRFIIETHLKNIDSDLAQRLRQVGLVMIKVGIESINPDAISQSKRFAIDQQDQRTKIREIETLGIAVTCFYILGMPGDTAASFEATMRYARSLNTLFAQISVFTPYPGTPGYREFSDRVFEDRFERFSQYDLVFHHQAFEPKQVRRLLERSYRRYYLRPVWVMKYLKGALRGRFA